MKQMQCIKPAWPAYLTAWQDNKPGHVLSSFPATSATVMRNVYDEIGTWRKKQFSMPLIIIVYNQSMGGTDSFDQRLSYIRPIVKKGSWFPHVFIHLVNCSVVDSYIIYQKNKKKPSRFGFNKFLQQLILELAEAPPIANLQPQGPR
jgi:hypothetical protein